MSSSPPVNRISGAARQGPGTGEPELVELLAERIRRGGPIPFADYMETVLYHPEDGYYARERRPWGRGGDYLTTPQVGAALGMAIAAFVREAEDLLGGNGPYLLVEVGGGDGRLLADVCRALERRAPGRWSRTIPVSVERSRRSRRRQERRFREIGVPVRIVESLDGVGGLEGIDLPAEGCVFSNELLDAFPVHRVVGAADGLREIWVDLDEDGRFVDAIGPPSTPRLAEHLDFLGVELEPGQRGEIALGVDAWIERVAGLLRRGFLLTVDYGHPSRALYAEERRGGTLACHRRYRVHDDPYVDPGGQDLTAHVDLDNLRLRGEERGFRTDGMASLAAFLLGFGAADDAGLVSGEADLRRHMALRHLLVSEVGQAHRVVLQSRDVESAMPFGTERLEALLEEGGGHAR